MAACYESDEFDKLKKSIIPYGVAHYQ